MSGLGEQRQIIQQVRTPDQQVYSAECIVRNWRDLDDAANVGMANSTNKTNDDNRLTAMQKYYNLQQYPDDVGGATLIYTADLRIFEQHAIDEVTL